MDDELDLTEDFRVNIACMREYSEINPQIMSAVYRQTKRKGTAIL
jgi:hypothetical protein